jgi:hypothetical protein
MIDLTVESARLREKQLENEIGKDNDIYMYYLIFSFYF